MIKKLLNILVFSRTTSFHNRGGFEDHIDTLYKGLSQKGHKITFVTTAHPEKLNSATQEGVTFHFLKKTKPGLYSSSWWTNAITTCSELCTQQPFDLIHSQSFAGWSLLKNGLAKRLKLPIIFSFHGTTYDEYCTYNNVARWGNYSVKPYHYFKNYMVWKKNFLFRDSLCFQAADHLIATSNEQKEIYEKIYRADPKKIQVIFNGMDVDQFSPQSKPSKLLKKWNLSEKFILLGMARMEEEKGLQFIVDALPEILKASFKITLLLVGTGGFERSLQHKVLKLGLSDHVIFMGKISFSDVAGYMNLADIFINATLRQNGYDLTLVEAMACEKPVIATQIGSHPTLILNGINGILTPIASPAMIAKSVIDMIKNRSGRLTMGKLARQTILSKFTAHHMIDATENLFYKVIHCD